jgi:hypothetical protein
MNFIERIKGVITNPDKTMEDVAKEPRIEEAAVVVAVFAIFAAIMAYLSASHVHTEYINSTVDMNGIGAAMSIMAVVVGLISPFILWVIVTVILYLFAMVFGGEGKFTHLLTAIGFTDLVKVFALIVAILLLTQAPSYTMVIDASHPFDSLNNQGARDYSTNLFVLLSQLVVIIGVLWSSIIGIFAVKHTEKVSMTQAMLIVGIPLAIFIILQLASFAVLMF